MENGIHKAIVAASREIGPIAKGRKNTQQNYQFRGIDDVYNDIQPVLAKHGIFTAPNVLSEHHEDRKTKSGGALIYRVLKIEYKFFAEDGSHVSCTVIGEGMDSGDKASNKAMAVAHKYALFQLFCIPTAEKKDPENESPEAAPVTLEHVCEQFKTTRDLEAHRATWSRFSPTIKSWTKEDQEIATKQWQAHGMFLKNQSKEPINGRS